jgi:predicted flap endonuclease-1-like 5' DNA nuclease
MVTEGSHMSSDPKHDGSDNCALRTTERNHYFHGKLMTTRDMEAEQQFHMRRLNTLSRFVTGNGVVCGLEAEQVKSITNTNPNKLEVTLEPGVALDCCGRQIVVSDRTSSETDRHPENNVIDLYINHMECSKESVPIPGAGSGCKQKCSHNRIVETFSVSFSEVELDSDSDDSITKPHKPVPKVEFPERSDLKNEPYALSKIARSYYEYGSTVQGKTGNIKPCKDCTDPSVFIGRFKKDEDKWIKIPTPTEPNLNNPKEWVPRSFVYGNEMLYAAISRHSIEFNNPHEVDLTAGTDSSTPFVSVKGGKGKRNKVLFNSPDNSVSINVPPNPGNRIDVTVPDRIGRYLMDQALKCTLKQFLGVAERFEGTEAGKVANQIVKLTQRTIEEEIFEKPGPSKDGFINFFLPEEENGKGFVRLGDDLSTTLTTEETATENSRNQYSTVLGEMKKLIQENGTAERKAIDVAQLATAQEVVCEAAEQLEINLLCADFNQFEDKIGETLPDPLEIDGIFSVTHTKENAKFSDIWPRAHLKLFDRIEDETEDRNLEISGNIGDESIEIQLGSQAGPGRGSELAAEVGPSAGATLIPYLEFLVTFPTTFYVEADVVVDTNYTINFIPIFRVTDDEERMKIIDWESTPRNLSLCPQEHSFKAKGQQISGIIFVLEGQQVVRPVFQRREIANLLVSLCIGKLKTDSGEAEDINENTVANLSERLSDRVRDALNQDASQPVPNLVGMTRERAENILFNDGWRYKIETKRVGNTMDRSGPGINDVIEQTPSAEKTVHPETEIIVKVVGSPSVGRINGIGPTWEAALAEIGMDTIADLANTDSETVTDVVSRSEKSVRKWINKAKEYTEAYSLTRIEGIGINEAEVLTDTVGIASLEELKEIEPDELTAQIRSAAESGEFRRQIADQLLSIDWNTVLRNLDD